MKNLFILGSPRKNGNSVTMAKALASGILQDPQNSVEYIHLNSLSIRPCQGCGGCDKTGKCIIKDDMQELYIKTDDADRLFFVSPIYFYSVSAQLKTFIDRCQAQWARKYLLKNGQTTANNRLGCLLSCAATNGEKLFEGSELIIKCLCDTLDIHYSAPLLIKNVDKINAIQKNKTVLANCIHFGSQLTKEPNPTQ
jgi:multimeric flavodoxin WrbA